MEEKQGLQPPDDELVRRVLGNDKQAFVELFDRYKDRVFKYLYGYTHDREKANDLTLETMMNAYNALPKYESRDRFSSWLFTIATNLAKTELARRKRSMEVSLEEPIDKESGLALEDLLSSGAARPDERLILEDLKDFIYKILAKLDEKYREVILLYDIEEMSYLEIARILKCNPITVGTRLKRARRQFYELLKEHKGEL